MRNTRQPAPPEMDRLELTVRRLLEAHDELRRHSESADARVRELESAMAGLANGRLDPVALEERIRDLEADNESLRTRIAQAYEAVERMRTRLQFVEEDR